VNELIELFKDRAEAVGARVSVSPTLEEALEIAVRRAKGRGVLAAGGLGEEDLGVVKELCGEAGVELVTRGIAQREGEIAVGLSRAQWAVAELGSVVLDTSEAEARLASALPWVHVVVLDEGWIVRDLASLAGRLTLGPGSFLSIITGPSRTADIERVLTIGVHGPGEMEIAIVKGKTS